MYGRYGVFIICGDSAILRKYGCRRRRRVKVKPSSNHTPEIHGFCDASQEAYGACIYVRTIDKEGKWISQLLCARTRVAPKREWTIPRLELSGALLLVELANKVAESWSLKITNFQFWTDSTIVLGWLNSQTIRLKTFVSNHVNQILDHTDVKQWHHVRSEDNPADVASRGLKPSEMLSCTKWWNGPSWLEAQEQDWEIESESLIKDECLPEIKPIRLALKVINPTKDLLLIYSDWSKLVRIIAWLSKFIDYKRGRKIVKDMSRYLSVSDLRRAEYTLVKRAQLDEFKEEYHALENGKEVLRRSKLKGLYPILQSDGLILVGGRLSNALIPESQKHPLVLPSSHKITRMIFENLHKNLLHCGPQALLSEVRLRYWPLRGRVMARSVIARCVTCIRAKPKFVYPLMAPLPKQRVVPTRPFLVCGVDFAGPLIVRCVTGIKTWIAVFVCFTTRAIHLEAVVGLTSGAFITALRRFTSRRGKSSVIHSDNGTNFVGAQKELASYLSKCDSTMAREGIEWKFNPPSYFYGFMGECGKKYKTSSDTCIKG